MKKFVKRIGFACLASLIIFGCFENTVLAEETTKEIFVEETVEIDAENLPDNDELFAGYVEQVLYSDLYEDVSTYGNVGAEKLKTQESKELYEVLKEKFRAIAEGELASTELSINMKIVWTAEELGVSSITSSNVKSLVSAKFKEVVNTTDVLTYLRMDCPYELYWYDKTIATGTSYAINYNSKSITINGITMKCVVSEEFQNGGIYKMDVAKAQAAAATKAKATEIVAANVNATDYEKIVAYKEAICDLVSYNYAAADNDDTPYGNPWQLIWVFDGDDSTKVVCEGYAKAFQYLCDLSNLTCYTADGTMTSWSGAGGHMWNVVTLDGENYLVDITNCDSGTIGYPDKLFFVGTQGSVAEGYVFALTTSNVGYFYRENCVAALGEEILTLATSNYTVKTPEPTPDPEPTPNPEPETTPVTEVFADISENAWYIDSVQYVYDHGIMSGSNSLFNPEGNVTRAQVVSTLYKLAGLPEVTDYRACEEMVDIEAGQWYTDAVCWAYSVGVASGNSTTKKFNVSAPVTRQQLASFFYNFAEYKGLDTTTRGDYSNLAGADQVASYAVDTMQWAYGTGVITGSKVTDVTGATVYDLKPAGTATRAQLAAILQRFCEKYHI